MAAKQGRTGVSAWLSVLLLVVVVLAAIGLLAVDYRAALALAGGIVIALALILLLRRFGWRLILVLGVIGLLVVVVLFTFQRVALAPEAVPTSPPAASEEPASDEAPPTYSARVTGYSAAVVPIDERLTGLHIQEEISVDLYLDGTLVQSGVVFPVEPHDLESMPQGFLLREVRWEVPGTAELILDDGTLVETRVCRPRCPAARVELRDFPRGAFYAARDAGEAEIRPYLNTEIVRWEATAADGTLSFAMLPPPYSVLKPVLAPFLGVTSWGELGLVLAGMLITLILGIIQAFAHDWFKDLLAGLFKGRGESASSRRGRK